MKRLVVVGFLLGLLCPLAVAQTVTITFTGKAIDNPDFDGEEAFNGYAINQPVSFSIIINDSAPAGTMSLVPLTRINDVESDFVNKIEWSETNTSPSLFTTISGTGIIGAFAKPEYREDLTFASNVSITDTTLFGAAADQLSIRAVYAGPDADMGIEVNGNNISVVWFGVYGIEFGDMSGDDAFSLSVYLSSFEGSYSALHPNAYLGTYQTDDTATTFNRTHFSFDSVTISTTVVPEPSTYAALVGLLTLAFVAVRRRRRD